MNPVAQLLKGMIGIALVILVIFHGHPVEAQTQTSLRISPLRTEVTIAPGFVDTGEVQIQNTGTELQNIVLSTETFDVTNEQYDYLFTPDTEESRWVRYDTDSFSLEPGQGKIVQYSVSIPIEAEPQGYYVALLATHQAENSADGVSTNAQIASLLYISVSGDVERSASLIKLTSPIILFREAIWSALLQNSGTVHYRSNYTVTIQDLFGQTVSKKSDSRLVLPNSVRLIEGILSTPEVLGLYKVTYAIGLGDNTGVQETRWFIYLPPVQILLLVLIFLSLFVFFRKRSR